jgi:SAM-dependent methyltransferase
MKAMYSQEWFSTFAATVPASIIATELDGIARILPRNQYPRLLDVGCGIGRIAGPLHARGYAVTGLDINTDALCSAARQAPGPHYVALDQRHVDRLRWTFDGALVLWNSLGFVGRGADLETIAGLAAVLRPGGIIVFDLYHPDWLRRNERPGAVDERGAVVRRWLEGERCCHEIRFPNGQVDDIQFEVYLPEEMRDLACRAGLSPKLDMTRWNPDARAGADAPRYQLVCTRPAAGRPLPLPGSVV